MVYDALPEASPRTFSVHPVAPARRMEERNVTLNGPFRVLLVALLLVGTRSVFAQGPAFDDPQWIAEKGMDERFSLNLGGFFQKFGTSLDIGPSTGGEGTNIDLERDLGLGNQTSFRADGLWRFGRHGRLDFGYAGWTRKNTHTLERTIDVGDHEYGIGASIDFRQHTKGGVRPSSGSLGDVQQTLARRFGDGPWTGRRRNRHARPRGKEVLGAATDHRRIRTGDDHSPVVCH